MENNLSKKILNKKNNLARVFFTCIVFILMILTILTYVYTSLILPGRLEVDFFDVGQGDSELIKTPNHKLVLIDGGPDNLALRRLGETLPFYQKEIDYIILSHFHEDHIIGLLEVFKRYKVKTFIYIEGYSSLALSGLLQIAKSNKVEIISLKSSANIILGNDCSLNVINPNSLLVKPDQNNSIVAKLNCYNNNFIFSGDNNSSVERALIEAGISLRAEVLKASHHGSKTANSEIFLQAVNPKKFVISVGLANKFKHPSSEVLERVFASGVSIYRTDGLGTIRFFGKF